MDTEKLPPVSVRSDAESGYVCLGKHKCIVRVGENNHICWRSDDGHYICSEENYAINVSLNDDTFTVTSDVLCIDYENPASEYTEALNTTGIIFYWGDLDEDLLSRLLIPES